MSSVYMMFSSNLVPVHLNCNFTVVKMPTLYHYYYQYSVEYNFPSLVFGVAQKGFAWARVLLSLVGLLLLQLKATCSDMLLTPGEWPTRRGGG